MFCSTIIPTVGRPTLERAVISVLDQAFSAGEFEIIVVNDSGDPLLAADWQSSNRVQVTHTNRHERSVARNTGAAIAKGKYLHFLDDDDWLLPGAMECFWGLAQKADSAAWIYGGSQLVDRQGNSLIELHQNLQGNCFTQVMAGEWIPLQSSLVNSETFYNIGGFKPDLAGPEDIDLCRRIALHGDFATTDFLVSCISMGSEGSTTDWQHHAEARRSAREEILSLPGVFHRLRASAHESRWKGRITRIYLTSCLLNLQNRRLFTAFSRASYGLSSFALAVPSMFSKEYWQSVLRGYTSDSFTNGFKARSMPSV